MRLRAALGILCLTMAAGCGDDDVGSNQNNNTNGNGVCGDGALDPGEQCDLGAANSDTTPDGCRTDCRNAYCGDGVHDSGEQCDDGNGDNNDDCVAGCLLNVCGDGYTNETLNGTQPVERCDDGNTLDGDDCRGDCQQDHTLCGNGIQDPEEECDDGGGNSDTLPDACRTDCTSPLCGDGVVDAVHGEACDDGAANSDTVPDACRTDCSFPACGDSVVDTVHGETCDDGAANSDTVPDACRTNCYLAYCGDNVIDQGEICDGTNVSGESCTDHGFDGGSLKCNNECTDVETSMCTYDNPCDAVEVGFNRCTGDIVEECDGTHWIFDTDCTLSGLVCYSQGYGHAVCN